MTPKECELKDKWITIEAGEDLLIDHYWYLIVHKDFKTPMKALYHSDCPHFTFFYEGGEGCTYLFEDKITCYMELPEITEEFGGNEERKGEYEFIEILAQYVPDEVCIYPEYRGKPYYSIHYKQNGETLKFKLKEGQLEPLKSMYDYRSPIKIIATEVQTKYENDCVSVCRQYGFNVDKDELAKALAYDRDQYNKGFKDGYNQAFLEMQQLRESIMKLLGGRE